MSRVRSGLESERLSPPAPPAMQVLRVRFHYSSDAHERVLMHVPGALDWTVFQRIVRTAELFGASEVEVES